MPEIPPYSQSQSHSCSFRRGRDCHLARTKNCEETLRLRVPIIGSIVIGSSTLDIQTPLQLTTLRMIFWRIHGYLTREIYLRKRRSHYYTVQVPRVTAPNIHNKAELLIYVNTLITELKYWAKSRLRSKEWEKRTTLNVRESSANTNILNNLTAISSVPYKLLYYPGWPVVQSLKHLKDLHWRWNVGKPAGFVVQYRSRTSLLKNEIARGKTIAREGWSGFCFVKYRLTIWKDPKLLLNGWPSTVRLDEFMVLGGPVTLFTQQFSKSASSRKVPIWLECSGECRHVQDQLLYIILTTLSRNIQCEIVYWGMVSQSSDNNNVS